MSWPNYPEYKYSGTDWLGSIPDHWSATKLKWSTSMVTSGSRGWAQYYADEGDYFVRIGNLSRGSLDFDDSDVHYVQIPPGAEGARTMTRSGDLLFSITAYLGSVAVVDAEHAGAYVSQHVALARLSSNQLDPWYAGYVALSNSGQRQLREQAYGGTKIQLSLDDIRSLVLPLPSAEEQKLIVKFLDRETTKIDALIGKQEQLIATLREDRTATITHAVTKGLDPDVEMQDSGVEWLVQIPRHWVASRLKNNIRMTESGTSVNAGDWPAGADEVGVLKTSCVSAGWFNPAANKTVVEQDEINRLTCPVRADSLIVNRANTPLLVGSAGYAATGHNNLFLSDKLWQVQFDGALAQFIYYWTQTEVYRSQIVALCVGASSSMQNLAMTDFRNIAIALPPADKQVAIVEFLSDRTANIDNLINKSTDVIDALQEYRLALITDAVTGKIDVRGAA